jgi:AcrR family transcriptional regulator
MKAWRTPAVNHHIRIVCEKEVALAAKRRAETMEENRIKLIGAARKAFAASGFAAASMDDLTAQVGLTRGALYHGFGDKKGLLAAVVAQVDGEMAARARQAGATAASPWERLLAVGEAYIGMALDLEVRRIVLLDGPAFLGDPSRWPSQNACLSITMQTIADMIAKGIMKPVDIEAASRLLGGAAFDAALWVADSDEPHIVLPKAIAAFRLMAEGFRASRG